MTSDGLAAYLSGERFDIVATATDARDVLGLAELARPDVAVLDVALAPVAVRDLARKLVEAWEIRIVLLGSGLGALSELDATLPHAHGFVLLTQPARVLSDTITRVANGELCLPGERPRTVRVLAATGDVERLGRKQLQVLELIADGHTSQAVADTLGIHVRTVENHRATIMRKFGVHNVVQLVRSAIRSGLVDP